jgi:CheY-like chemotaxis protein
LLVEDDQETLRPLARLFLLSGYEAYTASTSQEALDLAKERRIDVVVCDVGLPDETGLKLMPMLKTIYGIKGIAVTGWNLTEKELHAACFDAHLEKPIVFKDLLAMVDRICHGRSRAALGATL